MKSISEIRLRDITEQDLPVLFKQQLDPEATKMAAFPSRPIDEFIAHWKTKVLPNVSSKKKIIMVDEAIAGYVASWKQDEKQLVGYWIGKEYWGKGIATSALSNFLKELKDRPLHAYVAKHNVASIRVLEKCGFKVVSQGVIETKTHVHNIEELLMELA